MLDLYTPFTAVDSVANYFIAIRNFVRSLSLFSRLQDGDITLTGTSVKFDLTRLGMDKLYLMIKRNDNSSYWNNINITTNFDTIMINNSETQYPNCKVLTLQSDYSSGFWYYTPNFDWSAKIIITDVSDILTNQHRYVLLIAYYRLSNPDEKYCFVHYNSSQRYTIPSDAKYTKSTDTYNAIIDNLYYDTYKFTDVYVISGGHTTDTFTEALTINNSQYIKLAGNIYVKNSSLT
jgi:hypothetical protein